MKPQARRYHGDTSVSGMGFAVIEALALAVCAGICNSMQGPTNTALSTHVGRAQASLVSFLGGTLLLGASVLVVGQGDLSAALRVPPWQVITGILGFYIVMSVVYATPRLGIAFTLMILMFGKLVTGACIDGFGLFLAVQKAISMQRVAGLLLVAVGIILVSIGRMRVSASAGVKSEGGLRAALVVTLAGAANAIQAPILAALSTSTGALEASLVNFIGGLICACLYVAITQRGHLNPFRGVGIRPWQVLGGLYGTVIVLIVTTTTPVLGVGLLVSAQMCGQLTGGMIIDAKGWLGCRRIPVSVWRVSGILAVAAGVLALATC